MVMEKVFLLNSVLAITIILIFFSLNRLIKRIKPRLKAENVSNKDFHLPPGRLGLPFIGETLEFSAKLLNGNIEKFVSERMSKYSSKIFKTSLIGHPMAVLCGVEGNKFLFSNENKTVQVWWPCSVDKLFVKSHAKSNHEEFIKSRKMLSSFIKPDALRKFVGTMDKVMKQRMIYDWDCKEAKVSVLVRKYTLSLACRLFMSVEGAEEVENFTKPFEVISAGLFSMGINFPGTAFSRAMKASKSICKELEKTVKQRKTEILEKKTTHTQDILSHMLLIKDENGQFLKEEDIASHVFGLINGSYDTLNSLLMSIMKFLAEIPEVYDEVRREQMKIVNAKEPNDLLNWEDVRKMKYSWNVASEVLRLYPPIFGTFREAMSDFTYAGHAVPKGWKLHWNAYSTHTNSEYFPEPKKFDPSRFDGNGPIPYSYVPFGGGPRMCPGNEYTRLVILVFMHNAVVKFRWEKMMPDEKIVYEPHPKPEQGLPIRLYPNKMLNFDM